jgi:transcriptional regulator with XRE-family HTH domain
MDRAYILELERGKLLPFLETLFGLSIELKVTPHNFVERIGQEIKIRK